MKGNMGNRKAITPRKPSGARDWLGLRKTWGRLEGALGSFQGGAPACYSFQLKPSKLGSHTETSKCLLSQGAGPASLPWRGSSVSLRRSQRGLSPLIPVLRPGSGLERGPLAPSPPTPRSPWAATEETPRSPE